MAEIYNKTQLTPQKEFSRHVYHRDQFAHYLRWTHVLKCAKVGQTILDFGCGSGEMFELFYRNKFRPEQYVGLDIRERTIRENTVKYISNDNAYFQVQDLCKEFDLEEKFDIITSFEVIEHISHENIDVFLQNIVRHSDKNTLILISTPNYDPTVGAAENHILGPMREIGEWKHSELQKKLEEYFVIEKKFGTFASMKDYKHKLNDWQKKMFDTLSEYYDVNIMSVLMAPMFPEESRNTLWKLRIK
jgi:2-polyprenyl-3-methyl-5-hydroxy-6-metoxy-1,4-benzoquinol methylase